MGSMVNRHDEQTNAHTHLDEEAWLPREGREDASCSTCSASQSGHCHTHRRVRPRYSSIFSNSPIQSLLA
jgi:seryl-tRNA synthetase